MKSSNYTFAQGVSFSFKAAILSLLVVFFGVHASAQSQKPQTIRGIVKSADDNQPVPGANVFLKSQTSIGTLTDADGQFEFPRQLTPGEIVVFSFMGLKTTEYIVPEVATGLITISMPVDPIQIVDDILVEGSESDRTVASAKRQRRIRVNR